MRIKLSELCYKSIACDVTEDKKHIDLSAEPMVLVCAAGLGGSNADDVGKEIAIYRAHRAAPVVIATEGGPRFDAALETILVPVVHPALGFVLSAMAGHLFGYEAALAIDASARPLREARAAIQAVVAAGARGDDVLTHLAPAMEGPSAAFLDGLRSGGYDGSLEAGTAVRIASLLRYATGIVALDAYQVEHGKVGTPSTVVEDLTAALTKGIEELTRPVDAIKHQAKTVTVGISALRRRAAPGLAGTRGARGRCGARRAQLPSLAHTGRARSRGGAGRRVHALSHRGRSGHRHRHRPRRRSRRRLARSRIPHRHRSAPRRSQAPGRHPTRGHCGARPRDGRTIVIVPEVKDNEAIGLTLLHVQFAARLTDDAARSVLQGYQGRYGALRDAVTETTPTFDDSVLATVDLVDLLTQPVVVLADRWR